MGFVASILYANNLLYKFPSLWCYVVAAENSLWQGISGVGLSVPLYSGEMLVISFCLLLLVRREKKGGERKEGLIMSALVVLCANLT